MLHDVLKPRDEASRGSTNATTAEGGLHQPYQMALLVYIAQTPAHQLKILGCSTEVFWN